MSDTYAAATAAPSNLDPRLAPPPPESPDSEPDHQTHPPTQEPFPAHTTPRIWFLTSGLNPIALVLARALLEHGDKVVVGIDPGECERAGHRKDEFRGLVREVAGSEWGERFRVVGFDARSVAECQAAVAETIDGFGRIDILLCCNSEALVGTIEELGQSARTQSLIGDQFATNFFGPVNVIKAALPQLRAQRNGHIILLTGITGHLGTPGLGMYCASQWAIEGYCDSLAYEIAPFNLKLSIVQSNIEVSLLTNKLVVVPSMAAYSAPTNTAPLARAFLGRMLDRLDETTTPNEYGAQKQLPSESMRSDKALEMYPSLPSTFRQNLTAETVYAIVAIGGHENPPARHIVGHEGVASVKEKLRTVSEELEDFLEVSGAVDL